MDPPPDYFTIHSPRPRRPSAGATERYLEYVPRVSSPLTSPPLSPTGEHDTHYLEVFSALGIEGPWSHDGRGRRTSREELVKEEPREDDKKSRHRSLFHWRRAPPTLDSPSSDSDHTSSDSHSDEGQLGVRRRRYPYPEDGELVDGVDVGSAIRREMRERRYRRWDPVSAEASSSRVTLAQLLAEELAYARALDTLEKVTRARERAIEEKDEFDEGSAEGSSEGGHGGSSDGGHGSAEGGSDESGASGSSGMWEGSSEETSDGHAALLRSEVPPKKRGRSKLRRRRPPPNVTNGTRSRSETPRQMRDARLETDGIEDIGCLPCSLGAFHFVLCCALNLIEPFSLPISPCLDVRRSIRYWSSKLKLRKPDEIPPALQALVERPMSPEEYHQYFLSLYLHEGELSDSATRGGERHTHQETAISHDRHTDGMTSDGRTRPDHVRASTH